MDGILILAGFAAAGLWLIVRLTRKYRRWRRTRKSHQIFHITLSLSALDHYQKIAAHLGVSVGACCSEVLEQHALEHVERAAAAIHQRHRSGGHNERHKIRE